MDGNYPRQISRPETYESNILIQLSVATRYSKPENTEACYLGRVLCPWLLFISWVQLYILVSLPILIICILWSKGNRIMLPHFKYWRPGGLFHKNATSLPVTHYLWFSSLSINSSLWFFHLLMNSGFSLSWN